MAMTETIIVGIAGLVVGLTAAYFLFTKTKLADKLSKEQREKEKIINNPELLLEKLNHNINSITDEGQKLEYCIEGEGKDRKLVLKKTKVAEKDSKRISPPSLEVSS